MRDDNYRWLFLLTVVWGMLIPWIAPHPPMIDLPQHAGQIALLRDLLLQQSPWWELFHINFFTPYLLGYGLALPLTFVMPISMALQLLLSCAFVAFVWLCARLRRQFGADPRLDWLFLPGFFGFAYNWGFFTFILAAPVGLWFILLAERYTHYQTGSRVVGLIIVGLILLASHGLVFLFAWGVGAAMLVLRLRQPFLLWKAAIPYVVLLLACAGYFLINRHINTALDTSITTLTTWSGGPMRLPKIAVYTLTSYVPGKRFIIWAAATMLLALTPWLLGLRVDWRLKTNWVAFVILLMIFLLVPSNAFSTVYLYQRFALFLLPAYAWMFTRTPEAPVKSYAVQLARASALPLLILVCWSVLLIHSWSAWQFRNESAQFDTLIERLEPGQRALSLMFDPDSPAGGIRAYTHYAAWYQAERQGLVDFNFAWFPPQIVRYRPDKLPAVKPGFEWHPERFDWRAQQASNYRYFFVRSAGPLPEALFKGADCPPQLVGEVEKWKVFENRGCR